MTDKRYLDYIDDATFEWSDDTLEHHGVKGQKHGLRQYQNEDGSLTPLGREHYGVGAPRVKNAVTSYFEKRAKAKKNAAIAKAKKKAAEKKAEAEKKGLVPTDKVKGREKQKDYKNYSELKRDVHYLSDKEMQEAMNRLDKISQISAKAAAEKKNTGAEKFINDSVKVMKSINDVYDQINRPLGRTILKAAFDIELPKDPGGKQENKNNKNKK